MNRLFHFLATGLVALIVIGSASAASAHESSPAPRNAEQAVIDTLIARLESRTDAQFVRNGRAYPAATAGKFLRAKWKDRAGRIQTAEEFIEKIASRSSTTGRPYLVRLPDGSETPSRSLLYLELHRIRTGR